MDSNIARVCSWCAKRYFGQRRPDSGVKHEVQNLIEGLTILGDAIEGVSFYNSSGEDASFQLNRYLTDDERDALKGLGFFNYNAMGPSSYGPPIAAYISFRQF